MIRCDDPRLCGSHDALDSALTQVFVSYKKSDCGAEGGGDGCAPKLAELLRAKGWTVFVDQVGDLSII